MKIFLVRALASAASLGTALAFLGLLDALGLLLARGVLRAGLVLLARHRGYSSGSQLQVYANMALSQKRARRASENALPRRALHEFTTAPSTPLSDCAR